tara:strand:+ start:567 stop:2510 length:1944 start_codon:yes stop_codon:yes gene_type:complete
MALTAIKLAPGIDKQLTETGADGKWVDCDMVRFRYGLPEKIGGWTQVGATPIIGAPRAQQTFLSLASEKFDALATNKKQYIYQNTDTSFNDVSPQRYGDQGHTGAAQSLTSVFSTTPSSAVVTVAWTAHGAIVGDFVSFEDPITPPTNSDYVVADFEKEFEIQTVDTNSFTILMASAETNVTGATTSGSATATIQLNTGDATSVLGFGWSAGTWSQSTWGTARPSTVAIDAANWTLDLYGEDVIATQFNGGTYIWDTSVFKDTTPMTPMYNLIDYDVTVASPYFTRDKNTATMPHKSLFSLISTPDRHLVLFGTSDLGSTSNQDPMMVRFSNQEDITEFTPKSVNTAGFQRLSDGSEIRAAVRSSGQILIWTDTSLHSMQFIGPPFTFGFKQQGRQCGCVGQHAAVDVDGVAYWMGSSGGFLKYDGSVQTIPCTVEDYVFNDIRLVPEIYTAVNDEFNEISWFYPSSNSNTIDRVVTYNHLAKVWSVGTMARTTWTDKGVFAKPYATDYSATSTTIATPTVQGVSSGRGNLYAQETGNNANGAALPANITSGDFYLDAGEDLMSISRFIPDFKNLDGTVNVTLQLTNYPAASKTGSPLGPFPITSSTTKRDCRARARQVALYIASSALNDAWRFGTFRADLQKAGRR